MRIIEAKEIKTYIIENNLIETILEALNLENIKEYDKYYACSNVDGDNKKAIITWKDSLVVENNTRGYTTDLIGLVMRIKDISCGHAIKFICEAVRLDYYYNPKANKPAILQYLEMLDSLQSGIEEEEPLKPVEIDLFKTYLPYSNAKWQSENISVATQREFGIGFSIFDAGITIPIYDDIGTLVGVKCRKWEDVVDTKYYALYPYPKTRILYGLYKMYGLIKQKGYVVVVESEKSVLKLYERGIPAVAIAGHNLSESQVNKLERLNTKIVLAYDKDVGADDLRKECDKFLSFTEVYVMYDREGLLADKDSPADNIEVFKKMFDNKIKIGDLD